MIEKAVIKIVFVLAGIGILVYMIFAMAELSAQNKQLINVMAKMQQSWLDSNEMTISNLKDTDKIKEIYSNNFYKVLEMIKKDNGILEEDTPKSIKKYLQVPPKGIDIYD
tara:strand:+ start:10804 stop:11133 length:330 start_codon:yes stop_codon:yes gene_type:complete